MYEEVIIIHTPGTTPDPYAGDEEGTPGSSAVEVGGVLVEPRPSEEPVADARNAVTSGFTLYLPAGTPVGSRNQVTVRGQTYDVLGEPAVWANRGVVVQVGHTKG
jgi:hypothetical protein